MPLRKAKGNMYEFVTHTWNPVGGTCPHGCSYCYMKKMRNRCRLPDKAPFLNEKELNTNLKSGNYIFAGSSTDMFADSIPEAWITAVINRAEAYPGNQYLWHTKNTPRAADVLPVRDNFIVCTTLESAFVYNEIRNNAPAAKSRVCFPFGNGPLFTKLKQMRRMITVEPVMDFDTREFAALIKSYRPEQVNIGADTGHNRLPEPPAWKVRELIAELEKFTKVHLKKNLERILKEA